MRGFAIAESTLESFDRQYRARCRIQRPDRYRLLDALPADSPRIALGGGVSYTGAGFGNGATSVRLDAFDRLLAFDAERGLLCVEAGARIGEVQRFLLARGWYLPVSPGHPRASIGGCIAADVHGKNPARDGTFRAQVESLQLHRPGEGIVSLVPGEPSGRFEATFAGFGLGGTVVAATLRCARPPAALVVRRVPVADLAQAARVLREAANAPLLYGWHDARPGRFGRGVVRIGLAADEEAHAAVDARVPGDLPARVRPLPVALWNRTGIAIADAWLGWRWCRAGQEPLDLADALFPLNRARFYFAAYGPRGMAEAQWLVPHPRFEAFATGLAELVARTTPRIALVASKLFAGVADGFSFDGKGVALALQLPEPSAPKQRAFLDALAELAVAHDGRPNLIKDSTLDASGVRRAIGSFEHTRARLAAHNAGGLYTSELARRLAL